MVSTYAVEVGYNSDHCYDSVWEELQVAVANIRKDPSVIVKEVLRLEETPDLVTIKEILPLYESEVDLTMVVKHENDNQRVIQFASGGDPMRSAKESCRRAVCRLLLEHMHRKKMEVNIVVG
jgi:hypothetical protein